MGVSIVDTVSTLISVCEFIDDETFSDLEALVVTNAPKECLLIQGDGSHEFQTIKQVGVCIDNHFMAVGNKKKL